RSGNASSAAATASIQAATAMGRLHAYARASPADFQSPSFSHSRWPPSTAANSAPIAPALLPATRSIRTPASCSARNTPAWYAPAVPVPVITSAVRRRVEYGEGVSTGGGLTGFIRLDRFGCCRFPMNPSVVDGHELGDFEVAFGAVRRADKHFVTLFL